MLWRDLAVVEVALKILGAALARVAEAAATRREDGEDVAVRERQLRDGRSELALGWRAGVDKVSAERARLAAGETRRGEALAGAARRQLHAVAKDADLTADAEPAAIAAGAARIG